MNLVLRGASFNCLYLEALTTAVSGIFPVESSRIGEVINIGPAYVEIKANDPRLVFLNGRRLNPVFGVVEAAWVLAGRNDLSTLSEELPNYGDYSDDQEILNGAYGHRLREFFGFDQLQRAIAELHESPESRRVVLTMFSPTDLGKISRDIPCNTSVFVKIQDGHLDITVLNRSNDLYKGLPYNVFVFGVLQRFIAEALKIPVGVQRHFSDSLHLYMTDVEVAKEIVRSNRPNSVEDISSNFDWQYSADILNGSNPIAAGDYGMIDSVQLREFLEYFRARNRIIVRATSRGYEFSDGFLQFLAYQWLWRPGMPTNVQFEKIRSSLMKSTVKEEFAALGAEPGAKIAVEVLRLEKLLSGRYLALKRIIDENSGLLRMSDFGGSEANALRTLLICLVVTAYDPLLIGSTVGDKFKNEINVACEICGVSNDSIVPLSRVEDLLFNVIEEQVR